MASSISGDTDVELQRATPSPDDPPTTESRSRLRTWLRKAPLERRILLGLLAIFLCKGILFTFAFAPFSGHDEVMHYAYLQFVAEEWRPPVIPDREAWEEEYLDTRVQDFHDHVPAELEPYCMFVTQDWWHSCQSAQWKGRPVYAVSLGDDFYPSGWVYTANHPPLYYLLMTPVYWLFNSASIVTQLYALRLAAIPFGLIALFFSYKTVKEIFPSDRFLAITVPAFLAFQPQISYEAAMLNNDILAIATTSIVIYLLARGVRRGFSWNIVVLVGLFYGLAMLSKNTSATAGALIAIAFVIGIGWRNYRQWIAKGAVAAGLGVSLVWPWYAYMYTTYGDITGLNRIEELQRYWNQRGVDGVTIWNQLANYGFARLRWSETWGEYGWRRIPYDHSLMVVLFWICFIGVLGCIWWAVQTALVSRGRAIVFRSEHDALSYPRLVSTDGRNIDPIFRKDHKRNLAVGLMAVSCLVAYYSVLQFGTQFSLTQARYYFPSLICLIIVIMLGYRAMTPQSWRPGVTAAFVTGWFVLNIAIFTVYIIPYWYMAPD